ncbi:hypothetical protein AGRA3207_000983 [Actinomadura graeca]|uniref:Secreted protein n=1 Tax=Actinomadura graeca TaxID=2750812 RepID=A0ABX8QNY5_9ACTN|nr:HAD domain-containing protein [Actinomadura graeca]QXJ20295.1 hypothetical protein AGRA3207_000983 [Actinomadura graeca]
MTIRRPLLFLDIDGPLIPFGAASGTYPTHRPSGADDNPLLSRIDPEHGRRLERLDCELVWATTWMEDANECIAPRLGLPPLPLVTWPDASATEEQDERAGLHWKTRTLVTYAAERPFAWLDDEITDNDRTWASAHHPGPSLLHTINPESGITQADYRTIEKWLSETHTNPH